MSYRPDKKTIKNSLRVEPTIFIKSSSTHGHTFAVEFRDLHGGGSMGSIDIMMTWSDIRNLPGLGQAPADVRLHLHREGQIFLFVR